MPQGRKEKKKRGPRRRTLSITLPLSLYVYKAKGCCELGPPWRQHRLVFGWVSRAPATGERALELGRRHLPAARRVSQLTRAPAPSDHEEASPQLLCIVIVITIITIVIGGRIVRKLVRYPCSKRIRMGEALVRGAAYCAL